MSAHRRIEGRLDHPEARANSPQIVHGRELLPEIIRFACRLRRFKRAVLCYHENRTSPSRSRRSYMTALSLEPPPQSVDRARDSIHSGLGKTLRRKLKCPLLSSPFLSPALPAGLCVSGSRLSINSRDHRTAARSVANSFPFLSFCQTPFVIRTLVRALCGQESDQKYFLANGTVISVWS